MTQGSKKSFQESLAECNSKHGIETEQYEFVIENEIDRKRLAEEIIPSFRNYAINPNIRQGLWIGSNYFPKGTPLSKDELTELQWTFNEGDYITFVKEDEYSYGENYKHPAKQILKDKVLSYSEAYALFYPVLLLLLGLLSRKSRIEPVTSWEETSPTKYGDGDPDFEISETNGLPTCMDRDQQDIDYDEEDKAPEDELEEANEAAQDGAIEPPEPVAESESTTEPIEPEKVPLPPAELETEILEDDFPDSTVSLVEALRAADDEGEEAGETTVAEFLPTPTPWATAIPPATPAPSVTTLKAPEPVPTPVEPPAPKVENPNEDYWTTKRTWKKPRDPNATKHGDRWYDHDPELYDEVKIIFTGKCNRIIPKFAEVIKRHLAEIKSIVGLNGITLDEIGKIDDIKLMASVQGQHAIPILRHLLQFQNEKEIVKDLMWKLERPRPDEVMKGTSRVDRGLLKRGPEEKVEPLSQDAIGFMGWHEEGNPNYELYLKLGYFFAKKHKDGNRGNYAFITSSGDRFATVLSKNYDEFKEVIKEDGISLTKRYKIESIELDEGDIEKVIKVLRKLKEFQHIEKKDSKPRKEDDKGIIDTMIASRSIKIRANDTVLDHARKRAKVTALMTGNVDKLRFIGRISESNGDTQGQIIDTLAKNLEILEALTKNVMLKIDRQTSSWKVEDILLKVQVILENNGPTFFLDNCIKEIISTPHHGASINVINGVVQIPGKSKTMECNPNEIINKVEEWSKKQREKEEGGDLININP